MTERAVDSKWYVLAVLMLVYALNIADRFVVSTVLEPIRLELQLSDSAIAFLTGVALALFYVTVGLPIARIADRSNRRNIIVVSLALWSAMTALCGFARNFWQLLAARIGVGVGEAGGTPPSTSILADRFAPADRPFALTLFALGAPLGAWIGSQVAGSLADAYGWRGAFFGLGVPGLLVAGLVLLTVREPRRGQFEEPDPAHDAAGLRDTLRWLIRHPTALHTLLGATIGTLWGWGLLWWTPTFLMRKYGMTAGEAGAILGPMHLVAGTAITLAAGYVLSRPYAKNTSRISWIMASSILLTTIPSVLVYWTNSLALAEAMLWLMVPAVYLFIGPTLGVLQNHVPPQMRAQAVAILLFTANVANLIIAPQVVGFVSDFLLPYLGSNAESLRWALIGLALHGFWAAYHYAVSARKAG